MKPKTLKIVLSLAVVAALAVGGLMWVFRLAPTPPIFDENVTLVQARQQAAADGDVVLAVVTADFCPICQSYKRGALADEQVAQWAADHAQTVYLEWERDAATIAELGVEKWPATLVLDSDGQVLAMEYGKMSADELIAFGQAALAAPAPSVETESQTEMNEEPAAETAAGA